MNLTAILVALAPFAPWIDKLLVGLDELAVTELLNIIQTVQNQELKKFLTAVVTILGGAVQQAINTELVAPASPATPATPASQTPPAT